MTTVSRAVATRDKANQVVEWLRGQQADLAMAAASHIKPSTLVRVTQGALRRDEKLMRAAIASPQSLLYALLDCARLGHEPDTDQYYLVPFGSEVTGIEGYKGIVERMFRAGAVSAVVAEVVRQRDVYRSRGATTPPVHEFDEFADPAGRGELRGAYAYAVMLDGRCSMVRRMGRAEIMKHKAASRGSGGADSPWQKWEEAMWKKCPLRGLEAYVPTSNEWRREQIRAATVVAAENGHERPAPPAERPAIRVQPEPPPARAETFEDASPPRDVPLPGPPQGTPVERLRGKMFALFAEAGWGDRDDRLRATSAILGRHVTTSDGLARKDLDKVVGRLENAIATGDPQLAVSEIVTAYEDATDREGDGAPGGDPPPAPGGGDGP